MSLTITSIELFEILNKYKSFPFIFAGKPGSHGDRLIHQGAKKIFDLAGIKYQSADDLEPATVDISTDSVVYINGSGSFNNMWRPVAIDGFNKAMTSPAKAVIVGPSTFTEDHHFLNDKIFSKTKQISNKKVFIFCRERTSYLTLKKIIPSNFELLLDHDTALNLQAEDLLKQVPQGNHTLYAIREDKEQLNFEKPNLLSLWVDPIKFCKTFDDWIALHAQANKVITNRLHSSVLSQILGKNVTLLPNSYHKNRSVWEYSLKDRGILWQDKIEVSSLASFLNRSKLYKRLDNSYKVKKLCKKLYGLE